MIVFFTKKSIASKFARYMIIPLITSLVFNNIMFQRILHAASNSEASFLPPAEHPRLFLRSNDLPYLKNKLTDSKMKTVWQLIKSNAAINAGASYDILRSSYEANALIYLIENDVNAGKKAVALAKKTLSDANLSESYKEYKSSQLCGRMILGGAMVYDWCYNLLSEKEKLEFISYFEQLASKMELGYPPSQLGTLSGHSSGTPFLRDLLAAGIAIYDEKKDMYNLISNWIINEVRPAKNFCYTSEMHQAGNNYGPSRFESEMFTAWIFKRMGYDKFFSEDQGKVPYRWIYSRRPDGQLLRDGDMFQSNYTAPGLYWKYPLAILLSSSYYNDPYLNYEFLKQYEPGTIDPVFEFLFVEPKVESKSHDNLPLTYYFGYPLGSMIARTGWDSGYTSNSVVAEMKVGGYQFNNHQHLDAGSFQIYYKGALAIDSGIYEGVNQGTTNGYGTPYDINYYKRTIAHNSMLVNDQNEKTYFGKNTLVANDGGQRWPNFGMEPQNLDDLFTKSYKVAEVTHHDFGPDLKSPDFSYIKGNLTEAYSSKISDYKRSFVFLNFKNEVNPAALIVFDRLTSSNKNYKKTWLLHSIEEPIIKDNITTIKRTTNNYTGMLVNDTLLPEKGNFIINKVGGSGKEFEVAGKTYKSLPTHEKNTDESGSWRIEISPKTSSETDSFLNVMQVLDKTKTPLKVEKIDGELIVGAKLYDKVVVFSKTSNEIDKVISINVQNTSTTSLQYIITDVKEGKWRIYKNKNYNQYTELSVTKESGVLNFRDIPAYYEIVPQALYKNYNIAPTATPVPTSTSTPTPSPAPTATPVPTSTPTPSPAPTATPIPTSTPTPSPAPTATPVPTSTPTPSPAPTATPVPTSTSTPTPSPAPTATPIPTSTPTPSPASTATLVPTSTPTPSPAPTATPIPTSTPTPSPASTATLVPTSTPTPSPAPTATPIPTSTPAPSPASTATLVPTSTPTPSPAPTATPIPTSTPTPSPASTATPIPTYAPTPSPAPTDTPIPTYAPTPSPAPTDTPVPTYNTAPAPVLTDTPVPTATPTPTATPVPTATPTPTAAKPMENSKESVALPVSKNVQPIAEVLNTPAATATATATPTPTTAITPIPASSDMQNEMQNSTELNNKAIASISNMENHVEYKDVSPNHWAYQHIISMSNAGFFRGKNSPDTFAPDEYTTRAECAKVISEILEIVDDTNSNLDFTDVNEDAWYYKFIASAYKNGIISGRPDGSFAPNETITREDISVIIYRAIKDDYNIMQSSVENGKYYTFDDCNNVSDYAVESLRFAVNNGFINGKPGNILDPKGNTTRAEMAVIMHKLYQLKKLSTEINIAIN